MRNQALVLVQQLTAHNEEMKKTVVFNEGFDLLFQIIASEYVVVRGLILYEYIELCDISLPLYACHGYQVSYRVVHWRANIGLLLSHPTMSVA